MFHDTGPRHPHRNHSFSSDAMGKDRSKRKGKTKDKLKKTSVPGIDKLQDGRFRVRARWTDNGGIRRKREGTANTFSEAVALQKALKGQEENNRPERRVRLEEYAQEWIETHALGVRPATAINAADFLKPALQQFGDMYIDAIETKMVRAWYANLVASEGSIATKNKNLGLLKQLLEQAVEDELIDKNPAKRVKQKPLGPTQGAKARWLDLEGMGVLEKTTWQLIDNGTISEVEGRFILALLWTGCRFSEIAALRWNAVRTNRNDILIHRGTYLGFENETKTKEIRDIPVAQRLRNVLDQQLKWYQQNPGIQRHTDLVFPRTKPAKNGTYFLVHGQIQKRLTKVCQLANIERVTHHSLRRTMEQCLRIVGIDVLVRRAILGWHTSDVQGIYASVTAEEKMRAITLLEEKVHSKGTND